MHKKRVIVIGVKCYRVQLVRGPTVYHQYVCICAQIFMTFYVGTTSI